LFNQSSTINTGPKSPVRNGGGSPPYKKNTTERSQRHEQPLSYCRLHTEERAIRRAGYNYQVASKINTQEIIRRFEEKLAQLMEEREIKLMRKEMVPKAQLMPAFDKPFHPQRQLPIIIWAHIMTLRIIELVSRIKLEINNWFNKSSLIIC
ncbi:hypothetical protein BAE44_0022910, partial [Dichanthelium oligosanthes]